MPLAFFDLDGTLAPGPLSSEQSFFLRLLSRRRLGPRQLLAGLAFLPRGRSNKAYLAGLAPEEVEAWAESFIEARPLTALRASALERLESHRRAGDRLALLTGAPDFLAAPLARRLGFAHCIATVCAREEGRYSAAPPVERPYGAAKARLAAALCRSLGEELRDAAAYADSHSDLALLERVGRPVAVSPDARLARAARERGWELLER
ncbi:MAG: HAD-IB family phosphatase [Elusimicrobiota bacterium]|nr:HAD-IB family phosphatase [Elusimicrobiota bacterium]